MDVTKQEVIQFKNLLNYYKLLADGGINGVIEKWLIQSLDYSVNFFANLTNTRTFEEIKRVTINRNILGSNKRIKDIEFLKYPPAEKVTKYGRCNLPGSSVFYGTFSMLHALKELKPRVGDLITISTWYTDKELIYRPIFRNQPTNDLHNPRTYEYNNTFEKLVREQFEPNMREIVVDLTQFVADAFTKDVNPDNHRDYLFSSYFSNKILYEFEGGIIDAIYYPSVQDRLNFENIAIKPTAFEARYTLQEVKDSIVIVDPSRGKQSYMLDGIGNCRDFDLERGIINWDNSRFRQPEHKLFEYKLNFGLELD
jgi:hypothetical protein